MDGRHFDALTRTLSGAGTRRGLLAALAALPLLGGLVALFDDDDTVDAGERRQRRKRRNTRRSGSHKKNHHGKRRRKKDSCVPDAATQVCSGRCGTVPNNCQQNVDCGPCPCTPTTCANPTPICNAGVCKACSDSLPCPTGQCCAADGACGSCLVFATSTMYLGNLGGLTGADALCQLRADSVNLPGEYKAWLADSTGSPSTRFVQATVPYRLNTGILIANNWADLIDGSLAAPINVTEAGTSLGDAGAAAWTDTRADGTEGGSNGSGFHCHNWSSDTDMFSGNFGFTFVSDAGWTDDFTSSCTNPCRLYCFQQR